MKIRIKKNAYVWAGNNEMRNFLKENEGKFFEVETKYLFHNQYNIKDFRIYDSMIDCVIDDIRPQKAKCRYCGTILEKNETCEKHPDCSKYGMDYFTPENTYFIKYSTGCNFPEEKQLLSIDKENIKIGTYYLEIYPSLGYYRIYNAKQTINFLYDPAEELFFEHNGIGYTSKKRLNVPEDVNRKLREILNKRIGE